MIRTILSKLKIRFAGNGPGFKTVESVLGQILTRRQMQRVLETCRDRRLLVRQAAFELSVDESDLAVEVASRMKLPFLRRVMAFDIAALPAGIGIDDCREAGCAPLVANGIISGLACVDPVRMLRVFKGHTDVPLFISLYSTIEKAIADSEEYFRSREQAKPVAAAPEQAIVKKALGLIMDQARSHSARSFRIVFGENVAYQFSLDAERVAAGNVNQKIGGAMREVLSVCAGRESFELISRDGGSVMVSVRRGEDAQGSCYVIGWNTEQPARPEPAQIISFPESRVPAGVPAVQGSVQERDSVQEKTPPAAVRQEQQAEAFSDTEHTIMLIDDNQVFVKVLDRFFAKYKISSRHFADGLQALTALQSAPQLPDLIVCDVHMPEMNGFEFVKRMRSDPRLADLPVVMLTSDNDVETELRLLTDGADAFVAKNQDPRLLCVKVRKLIEKNAGRRAA